MRDCQLFPAPPATHHPSSSSSCPRQDSQLFPAPPATHHPSSSSSGPRQDSQLPQLHQPHTIPALPALAQGKITSSSSSTCHTPSQIFQLLPKVSSKK
ncbi:hypothetical protein PtA15_14A236 [Puccinia triticina]|uniref:Uncharacterized protein n=1 Tax=Puccinia triticina TaxID=208348 RepID=A0ABY7D2L3_9BASI|nr:uncharacterized protein PtA15_14A236 [Puccinia triticina]WAQ91353.1 hypothetical protein PtA15_14A236 [Puccinia triticina]